MERACLDFERLLALDEAAAFFVSRARSNTDLHRVYSTPSDQTVALSGFCRRKNPHHDNLHGGAGDDTLDGSWGDDELHGGDRLYGGTGADTFVYVAEDEHDRIVDFADGEDHINLSTFWDIGAVNDLSVTQDGANVVIDLTGRNGGTITIENLNLADLDDADFVFHQEAAVGGL